MSAPIAAGQEHLLSLLLELGARAKAAEAANLQLQDYVVALEKKVEELTPKEPAKEETPEKSAPAPKKA